MDKYRIEILDLNNETDIEYICQNMDNIFEINWNASQFVSNIQLENSITYILRYNDIIVGFICISKCLDEAEILNISIDNRYRNNGLGQYLLENVINILKQENILNIFLEVNVNNIFAIKLYKKNNFKIVSVRKEYYFNKINNTKDDAYVMTTNL